MHLPELAVIIVGNVFQYLPQSDFETKAANGAKVGVLSEGAATEVKFSQRNVEAGEAPTVGEQVALLVRPRPWKMDNGNAGVSFLYVRRLEPDDLDHLATVALGAAN